MDLVASCKVFGWLLHFDYFHFVLLIVLVAQICWKNVHLVLNSYTIYN